MTAIEARAVVIATSTLVIVCCVAIDVRAAWR